MLSRRNFIRVAGAALAGAAGVGIYTWRIEPHWVRFVRRPMPIPNLPDALDGATLVQLSDLHVGPRVDSEYLMGTMTAVRRLEPDLVVFTGDLATIWKPMPFDELSRVLEYTPHGRLGTFGVLGNHDYGVRWRQVEVANEVARRAGEAGITILRNARQNVEGLDIVGVEDLWGPEFDPMLVQKQWRPNNSTLALCHNPDAADVPFWSDFRGWILSGHTHGGQCKPPFLPPPLLPVVNKNYVAGEVDLRDGRFMYINRGLGHSLKVRFNVRPEVTIFELRRA